MVINILRKENEMYDYNTIETYASWILDDIKTARRNHKKINMKRLKSFGEHIMDWAEQEMCFEHNKMVHKS